MCRTHYSPGRSSDAGSGASPAGSARFRLIRVFPRWIRQLSLVRDSPAKPTMESVPSRLPQTGNALSEGLLRMRGAQGSALERHSYRESFFKQTPSLNDLFFPAVGIL